MNLNHDVFVEIKRILLAKADKIKKQNIQEHISDDREVEILRDQVKFYEYGKLGKLPEEWVEVWEDVAFADDPEWEQYKNLHKKFKKFVDVIK